MDVVDDSDDGLLSNNCTGKDLEVEEEEYCFGEVEDNADEPIPRPLKVFPIGDDGLCGLTLPPPPPPPPR